MKKMLLAVSMMFAVLSTAFAVDVPVVAPNQEQGIKMVNLSDIKGFDPKELMKKVPLASEKIVFNGYFFEPAQVLRLHKHPAAEEFFFIVEGDGQFTVGNDQVMVHDGSIIFGPANTPHGLVNSGTRNMVMVSVQGPKPVTTEYIQNASVKCTVCGQENIIPENAKDGDIIVCPRCHAKLKLSKMKDGSWQATQI